jgi:hypothetical protein
MGGRSYFIQRWGLALRFQGRLCDRGWLLWPQIGYAVSTVVPPVTQVISLSHPETTVDIKTLNRRMALM